MPSRLLLWMPETTCRWQRTYRQYGTSAGNRGCGTGRKNKFTKEERAAVPGLFAGAFGMITEFAIPFAAANPLTVIPSLMAGSAVGCALSYVFGLTMRAPHGGLFVLFALNNALLFIVALLIAGAVSAAY